MTIRAGRIFLVILQTYNLSNADKKNTWQFISHCRDTQVLVYDTFMCCVTQVASQVKSIAVLSFQIYSIK